MSDLNTFRRVPALRGIDRVLRGARLRAARQYANGTIPRNAILNGQWDGGAIVGAMKRAEDAITIVTEQEPLLQRLEEMRDFCEGAAGSKRPHPTNVARLCRDVLEHLKGISG